MPVSLRQYRGVVGVFNDQFVPYKQFNFFYSDSFRKLNMPAVSNVSFLIPIYVFIKLLVPNVLPYMFLSRKNIKKYQLIRKQRSIYFDVRSIHTSYLGLFNSDYSAW